MKMLMAAAVLLLGTQSLAQEGTAPGPSERPTRNYGSDVRQWRFGLGLGYSLSSRLTYDDAKTTSAGVTTEFSAELDYKNTFVLNFEARNMAAHSWGFIGGLQYDGERDFDGGSITSGGTTVTLSSSGGNKIQVTNIFGSAVYQWEQFYLPFGLNISSVKLTPASSFTGSMEESGGIGAQLGIGFLANDNLAFELISRSINVKIKTTQNSGTSDYGLGFLGSLNLMAKYIF